MPTPTFDGDNLLIVLPTSSPAIDVQVDLYSEWKLWAATSDNIKYPQAFLATGGRDTAPAEVSGRNFFIRNDLGWRIRPAEEDADVLFSGNFFPFDTTYPIFTETLGAFTVSLRIKFSSLAFVEQTAGGLTAAQQAQLDRCEFLVKMFVNRAVTNPDTPSAGQKRIDFYDDDQSSIIEQLTISADGNERTQT